MAPISIDEVAQRLEHEGFETEVNSNNNLEVVWDGMFSADLLRLTSYILGSNYDFSIIGLTDTMELRLIPWNK